MSSPTQDMWECKHGVDGRDWCYQCHGGLVYKLCREEHQVLNEVLDVLEDLFYSRLCEHPTRQEEEHWDDVCARTREFLKKHGR